MTRGERTHQWLEAVVGDDSNRLTAKKSEIEQSSLLKRRKSFRVTADDVIAIARAYGKEPVQALVDTGFLSEVEVKGSNIVSNIAELSDLVLLSEIKRRFQDGSASSALTDPVEFE
ncbi:MAG: hypothetical protein V7697_06570 [Rhodococcus erythropolis]